MDYKVLESMLNPVRMRIIQTMSAKETVTTKELAEVCVDVPPATLYRHINRLVKDGIIKVVSENKVRGTMEKVYSLRFNPYSQLSLSGKELDPSHMEDLFYQFSVSLMRDFHNYLQKENLDYLKDGVGFSTCALYLSDKEFEEFAVNLGLLIQKAAANGSSQDRKIRKISTIIIPYEDDV